MQIVALTIPDLKLITPAKHGDHRGFFSEVFKESAMREAGLPTRWAQDNHSRSPAVGTLRGLHFQKPPFEQSKLVRVSRGRILDVAVDIRRSSSTFGKSVSVELSADNWNQLFIPAGFAHGFCTLSDDVEVQYKTTAEYNQAADWGIAWDDPDLKIEWPFPASRLILSEKDRNLRRLKDLPVVFA